MALGEKRLPWLPVSIGCQFTPMMVQTISLLRRIGDQDDAD